MNELPASIDESPAFMNDSLASLIEWPESTRVVGVDDRLGNVMVDGWIRGQKPSYQIISQVVPCEFV